MLLTSSVNIRMMISSIIRDSPAVAAAFRDVLERLASASTEREVREELNEAARDVLKKYGWDV